MARTALQAHPDLSGWQMTGHCNGDLSSLCCAGSVFLNHHHPVVHPSHLAVVHPSHLAIVLESSVRCRRRRRAVPTVPAHPTCSPLTTHHSSAHSHHPPLLCSLPAPSLPANAPVHRAPSRLCPLHALARSQRRRAALCAGPVNLTLD